MNETDGLDLVELGATFYKCDISNSDQVEKLFEKIKDNFPRLDCLIANAGIVGLTGFKLCDTSISNYKNIKEINTDGTWYTLKYGLKLMEQYGNGGAVVVLCSITGRSGSSSMQGVSSYGISKHAIAGMTQIAALESIKSRIRVNAVCPTIIITPLFKQHQGKSKRTRIILSNSYLFR